VAGRVVVRAAGGPLGVLLLQQLATITASSFINLLLAEERKS